jgi:hypothetical protein
MATRKYTSLLRALHDALDVLVPSNGVLGIAVEHRGIDMIVTYKGGKRPWYACAEREQENTIERKFIEADGGTTVEAALDACAEAVEAFEDDGIRSDEGLNTEGEVNRG